MISEIYIDPEVFEWPCLSQSGSYKDESCVRRSYEMLEHAERLIAGDVSELKTADAISNLKRAINVRLKLLDEYHRFSDSFVNPRIGALERLELVGLARHFIIKQLFELRNDIEHNDVKPPPIPRVRELLDVAWYFLKTTDAAAGLVYESLEFEASEEVCAGKTNLWLAIEIVSVREHRMGIRGVLAAPFISSERGWKVEVRKLEPAETVLGEDAYWFVGEIVGQPSAIHMFWRRLFSAR
jgi:hypothetical protein